jgi:hypothetical protein
MLHRMTASPATSAVGGGSTQQAHSQAISSQATTSQAAPSQATSSQTTSLQAATRTQNPYQCTLAHNRASDSNIPQQQTLQYQMQPGFLQQQQQQQQQFNGQPPQGYGFGFQAPQPYGYSNQWQNSSQNEEAPHPVRFPAMTLPTQPQEVEAACTWAASCWPELPAHHLQGVFSISQTGEILTVRAPRDGEDWMRLNQREEDQRWAVLNATMAVLASAKTTSEKMMLEQFEALVQLTQFLEHLRKTMPMTEAQLDMVTTMHKSMFCRLNALEMLHKGGQRAVDEFKSSGLVGLEKRKANALQKAKRQDFSGGAGGNGLATKQRQRRAGGGPPFGNSFGNPAPSLTQTLGQAFSAPRQQQQQGIKCNKCHRFGHKMKNCQG